MINNKTISLILILISNSLLFSQDKIYSKDLTNEQREKYLQQALELRKQENYRGAVNQLIYILDAHPEDAPVLLLKGDLHLQGKEYNEAVQTYKELLPLDFEKTTTQINLSYALFMGNEASKALEYAKSAWENDKENKNAIINYFNALLWNIKTDDASKFLSDHLSSLKEDQALVMKARLNTSSGDYKAGLSYYDTLIRLHSNKHYVKEYTEVLLSKKEIEQAELILSKSEELYSESEFSSLLRMIDNAKVQSLGTETGYFEDIAGNIQKESGIWWQQRDDLKYRLGIRFGYSSNSSSAGEQTDSRYLGLTISEKWSMAWRGETKLNFKMISFDSKKNFSSITGKQSIQYNPTDRQMFGLFISSDILNYTASLLGQNIRISTLGFMSHIMFDGKSGVYTQGGVGIISDNNSKYEFFGSFYHLFSTLPLLKIGMNFSALHFKNNSISNYFSPDKYISTELFADYKTSLFGLSDLQLNVQFAIGVQNVHEKVWDKAYRLQAMFSYQMKYLEPVLIYRTSNVASTNGTGYQFDWFTLRLKINI